MNRRSFLQYGTAASLFTGTLAKSFGAEPKSGATVDTSAGKIRGLMIDKVNAFKGIPYGASPSSGDPKLLKSARIPRFLKCAPPSPLPA